MPKIQIFIFVVLVGCSLPSKQNTAPKIISTTLSSYKEWPSVEKLIEQQDQEFPKNYTQLEREYRAKVIQEPESPVWYFLYGRLQGLLGNPQKALHLFSISLQKDPDFLWAYHGLGVYYLKRNSAMQAELYFQKCLRVDPLFIPALVGMAKISTEKDLNKAIEFLEQAITIRNNDGNLRYNIAHVYLLAGNDKKSLESFQEASRLSPDNINIKKDLAKLLIRQKKYSEALLVLQEIFPLLPTQESKRQLQKTIKLLQKVTNNEVEGDTR